MVATQWIQDAKKNEVLPEKKSQETIDAEKWIKDSFEKSENFKYLKNNLEPTKKSEDILDKITNTLQNLKLSNSKLENSTEKLWQKYEFSKDISIEELAIIDAVENKIWKNLKPEDKLELIRLLSWIKIKEVKKENKTEKSNYSKEIINNPNISIIEWFYLKWAIPEEDFIDFISSNSFERALEKHKNIKQLFENLEKNNSSIDFFKEYWNYIPEQIKESFIIKQLEENFIWPIELKESNAKEYNLFVSLEKVLNNTLSENKYFYKPDSYYDAIDIIRKVPEKSETINDFFKLKLRALGHVMELATGQNPWRIEEKNLEAWEQKVAVGQKEEEKENKELWNKNLAYEKIKMLLEKNDELGQRKIFEQNEQIAKARIAEKEYKIANNIDFKKTQQVEWENVA